QEFDRAKEIQPRLEREADDAARELTSVTEAWDQVKERGFKHESALKERDHAKAELLRASGRVQEVERCRKELADADAHLIELQGHLETAANQLEARQLSVTRAEAAERLATARVNQHQESQSDLTDRQGLLTVAHQLEALAATRERAQRLDERRKELEELLAGPPPCSEQRLQELRDNRRQ